MRDQLMLSSGWHVSPSAHDAALAASGPFDITMLEYADDVDNHPRPIDLPGGPQYGKRPLTAACGKDGERLPSPFLSYAKQVMIPYAYRGHAIFLDLDRVRYHVTVTVNDQVVCQYVGGWEPHRVEITDVVTPGQAAMIVITVGDSGVSGKRVFDPYNYTGTRLPTCQEIQNNLVHPVAYGGADRAVASVAVTAVPRVRTEYVFANPKVSRGVLEYTVALVNESDREETVRVVSEAVGAKLLLDRDVTLPAHATEKIAVEVPWVDAILWDIDNPHLYNLRTVLTAGGQVLDEHADYFGFREFTIRGHSYYLNGKKIHLHGNSGHIGNVHNAMSLDEKIQFYKDWKEIGNCIHIRLHARPQDPSWVEAADRAGMLITTETALWTTGFYSFDWAGSEEGCYENVRYHFMEALVRRDRNRPSVVLWSLSNEMSPITPWDLENPKMAAMTRIFKKIIAEAEAEDDSRVIQMSSAMDFIGNLKMYNLHYPKNWQAFPDYPHTAYWLDGSFLFPWYGPVAREHLPAWSWRKDKPLYFGEFTCVFGATPDCQANIVGDIAFEDADHGTGRVQEKLWPLEVNAYRRRDVSGFCAWAAVFSGDYTDVKEWHNKPQMSALAYAQRPVAVLDHSFRTQYFAGDEVAIELSIHNDTRDAMNLVLRCEVLNGDEVIWSEAMPSAPFEPATNLAFTSRFRAPRAESLLNLTYRATLTSGDAVKDAWEKTIAVHPLTCAKTLPVGCLFLDPNGELATLLQKRGLTGATCTRELDPVTGLAEMHTLWLNFDRAQVNAGDWRRLRTAIRRFVEDGGCVVLDQAPQAILDDLPIALEPGKGYAADGRLEITYAYSRAPFHPVVAPFNDADFALWGGDYYLAHRCVQTPQHGNAIPLLVAGTDTAGLTSSPLLEIRHGKGSYLVSTLELFPKLLEAPVCADILRALAAYRPQPLATSAGVCVGDDALRCLREVGYEGESLPLTDALQADVAIIDGECLADGDLQAMRTALAAGRTVYLHALDVAQTQRVLGALELPGTAVSGEAKRREYDIFRHTHPLANGMTHNYLYWTVDRAKLAAWTPAKLHPEPATALIQQADGAAQITRRGAVTIYTVGMGTLVIDNLRWHLAGFDEPERPRRYLTTMLTNLGVPLTQGIAGRISAEFETAEERRERGHF